MNEEKVQMDYFTKLINKLENKYVRELNPKTQVEFGMSAGHLELIIKYLIKIRDTTKDKKIESTCDVGLIYSNLLLDSLLAALTHLEEQLKD